MYEFNKERALAGEEIVTRAGESVSWFQQAPVAPATLFQLVGIVRGQVKTWTNDGYYYSKDDKQDLDLFMKHPATTTSPQQELPL